MEETNELMAADLKPIKKHFSRLGLWFFLGTIIINAVQVIILFPIMLFKPDWVTDTNVNMTLSMLSMYLIGMPAMIMLVRTIPGQKPEKHPMKAGDFIVAVIMCFAIMYICNMIGLMLTEIIGVLKDGEVENVLDSMLSGVNMPLLFVYTVICAPIMEEYVFRKLIVDRTMQFGQGLAVILSGLMFGLFHGNLNQFAYTFFLGMFLAFLYIRTGNLKITIALHMLVNFVGGVVSVAVTDALDLEEMTALLKSGVDVNAIASYFVNHISGVLMLLAQELLFYGSILVGGILLIVAIAKRRFRLAPGEVIIPRGRRFHTVICNLGMLLYCIFWIIVIVFQLFM